MDPITVIVTAIATGAIVGMQDTTEQIIKDAYAGLKHLILKKYSDQADVKDALKKVEARPDSEGRKLTLREELEAVDAGQDQELVQAARDFLAAAQPESAQGGQQTVTITGDGNQVNQVNQQAGDNAIQIGISRDVNFDK
jgi:hypothetical protein